MPELTYEQQTWTLKFMHPEKTYPTLTEEMLAKLFEMPLKIYRQIKEECAAATRQAAEELLADADFAARVGRLPFAPGSTVVGLGDSITDDWQSWIEIMR